MSYRAVYDAEHKGDRKWATIGAIEKSTYTGYCQHVRRLGDLGEIPVDRVTAQDVQLYIDSLVEDGYCSETVNLMLWTVRETLELASFRMLRTPLDLRRIRSPKHDRPLPRALSAEEKNALLAALPCIHGPLDTIVRLALFAGLRCGEICALRWSDIDFEKGTLSIKRTVQSIPGICLVFNAPKTRRGKRCLRIGADCVELLQEYRRYQKVERFRIGSVWVRKVTLENGKVVDNDMLFTKWNGEPMDPDIISSWFPKFLEAHDLPSIHFHSLRHSNVSILIAAHVPITTVSGRLGHAQTSTTLNYYASALQLGTHLLHKEGVVRAIGRLVLGGQDMSSLVERFGFTAKGPTHRHWSACRAYL